MGSINLSIFCLPPLIVCKCHPCFDLSINCIRFHPDLALPQCMAVLLKSSKTNSFRQGKCLTIVVFMAMQAYFLLARPPKGPPLCFHSVRFLTSHIIGQLLWGSARIVGLPYHCLKGQGSKYLVTGHLTVISCLL